MNIHFEKETQAYFCRSISKSHLTLSNSTTAYFTGVPETHLNFLTMDQAPIDLEKDLTAGKRFFATFNQSFVIDIAEEFCDKNTDSIFSNLGFTSGVPSVSMYLDLSTFAAKIETKDDTIIRAVDTNLSDWISPLVEAFESTPEVSAFYVDAHKRALSNGAHFYHFTLYNANQPVSSLTISVTGALARIDDVGTLPAFQGRGFATKLVTYGLKKAIDLGCTDCFLCASKDGLPLYQKLGFKALSTNRYYIYPEIA
jgi:ribosomal protein S18 acetylase RimI-like enzyme